MTNLLIPDPYPLLTVVRAVRRHRRRLQRRAMERRR
jgi:hypothetical protein